MTVEMFQNEKIYGGTKTEGKKKRFHYLPKNRKSVDVQKRERSFSAKF